MLNRLVMIMGRTGVGKTTLLNKLCGLPGFRRVVTTTSRTPRQGEVEGRDYYFRPISYFNGKNLIFKTKQFENFYGIEHRELRRLTECGETPVVVISPKGIEPLLEVVEIPVFVQLIFDSSDFDIDSRMDAVERHAMRASEENRLHESYDNLINPIVISVGRKSKNEVLNETLSALRKRDINVRGI